MTNNFKIAYQGSEGSYSEELLKKNFQIILLLPVKVLQSYLTKLVVKVA